MKTKPAKMLPKTANEITNGGVYLQRVRCGKANCKCTRGESHTAYYFFTRRNGKVVKTYIRKAEFFEFSRLVVNATDERKYRRQATKTDLDSLKQQRQQLRDTASLINSIREK